MNKKLFSGVMAASAILLTSCMGDSDHKGQIMGTFTLNNSVNGSVLYMDGGGIVTLSPTTVNTYQTFLSKSKRFYLLLQYPEGNMTTENGGKIVDAEIVDGNYIPVTRPMTVAEAEAKKVTDADSINEINNIEVRAYRGYFNVTYNSLWVYRDGKAIEPTLNMVVSPSDNMDQLDVTLYNNWHSKDPSKESKPGETTFMNSFDITTIRNLVYPTDTITLNIKVENCTVNSSKQKTLKIGYKDFFYPYQD